MRLKIGDKIFLCRKIAYDSRDKEKSTLVFWTFGPEKYIVNCFKPEFAKVMCSNALEKGFVDVSTYEYRIMKNVN